MKKQLMIFDFVCLGIGAIFLTFVAILQNCGMRYKHYQWKCNRNCHNSAFVYSDIT